MAKILIVEDDAATAAEIAAQLQAVGHTCAIRTDGRGIVELARRGAPDLVVLDVMMPEVSGFEVCRSLRKDRDLYSIPILIVSAMSNEEEVQHGLAQGADAYITKPFHGAELIRQVEFLLHEGADGAHRDMLTDLRDFEGVKRELRMRIGRGDAFALLYVELLNLRTVTKNVGDEARNKATRHLGRALAQCCARFNEDEYFVGHMGAGHFLCAVPLDATHAFCNEILDTWRDHLHSLYMSMGLPHLLESQAGAQGNRRALDLLICVTARDPKEKVSAQQMLDIVSRIRNNSAKRAEGGVHVDRRL